MNNVDTYLTLSKINAPAVGDRVCTPLNPPPLCTPFILFLSMHALTDNFFLPFDLFVMCSRLLGYVDRFVFFPKK